MRRAGLARWSTVALAVGLGLAALRPPGGTAAFVGLALAVIGTAWGAFRRHKRAGSALLVPAVLLTGLCSGLLLGTVRVAAIERSALHDHLGERSAFEVVVTSPVRQSGGWQSATVTIKRCEVFEQARDEKGWLEVPPEVEVPALCQGLVVQCVAIIQEPEPASESGFDQRRWLLQQGVATVLKVVGSQPLSVVGRRGGAAGFFDGLRASAKEHLALGPDPHVNGVLRGVVTGDTAGIEQGWLEAFRRAGTAHMLSVSGLHVASLAAIMMGLARLLRVPRWAGFSLAGIAAVLMIPFVGPSPPVIRAAIMIVLVLLGRWVGRGRDQWQVLALAAVIILAINPFGLFDVGFQLSFSALGGIMALVPPLQRVLRRLPEGIKANVAVSLAAGLGTAPVALAQFGRTSLVSPLANLLVVPTLPLVVGLGMASVFAGSIWHGLSSALDTLASLPMMWTVMVSRLMAGAPVLESGSAGLAVGALLGALAAAPVASALAGRSTALPLGHRLAFLEHALGRVRKRRPRHHGVALVAAVTAVVCGLVLGAAAWSGAERGVGAVKTAWAGLYWPDCVEVRVLDVGQGNAVLVRTPDRHALLFDGGPAGCGLAGQLRSLGVDKLDMVVISHPHADHFAGLLEALPEVEVGMLVDQVRLTEGGARGPPVDGIGKDQGGGGQGGQRSDEAQQYAQFRRQLAESGTGYLLAATGDALTVDGVQVSFFAPARPLDMGDGERPWAARGGEPDGDQLNAASLVAVLRVDATSVLLPGDAEADTLSGYALPPVDVLVVPHHGSGGAVTESLLERLGVGVTVVSVGADNHFGHPHQTTMGLLQAATDTVLRTDTAGWVCCRLRGGQIAISTERTPPGERQSPTAIEARLPDSRRRPAQGGAGLEALEAAHHR